MKTYLTPDEVKLIEEATTNLRDRLLIRLLFRSGCRISELLSISVDDVSFSSGLIMIKHLKQRIKYSCPLCKTNLSASSRYCPKCGAEVTKAQQREMEHRRQRTVPIDKETLSLLDDYIKEEGLFSGIIKD
jgi:integrase/recombinase XerD